MYYTGLLTYFFLRIKMAKDKCLRPLVLHGTSTATLKSNLMVGMKCFSVGKDNACLHFSLFCLTQFVQESFLYLTVCLTIPVTTEEAEPCPTPYGVVHESYKEMMDQWRADY